jgi:hypothetical protein
MTAHSELGGDDLAGVTPMRDWLLILVPIAAVTYFLAYPNEFRAFMAWFGSMIN